MKLQRSMGRCALTALLPLWLAAASLPALGADAKPAARARAPAASEIAACERMADRAARASCLTEARAAAALPPSPSETPEQLRENALKRCQALPEPDKGDCVARMQGKGTVSGSVEGGGLYRELVTREVGVPPASAASAPARPASAP